MAPRRGKRKSDTVDHTGNDGDESQAHPSKSARPEPSNQSDNNNDQRFERILGQRFGQRSKQAIEQRLEQKSQIPQNPPTTLVNYPSIITGVDEFRPDSGQISGHNRERLFQNPPVIPPIQPSEVSAADGFRQIPRQRLGQNTQFVPLSQLSQISGADEDDAQAADLIQGSQDFDDASFNDYVLYGMFRVLIMYYLS